MLEKGAQAGVLLSIHRPNPPFDPKREYMSLKKPLKSETHCKRFR